MHSLGDKGEDKKVYGHVNNKNEDAEDKKGQGKDNDEGNKGDKSPKASHSLVNKGKED